MRNRPLMPEALLPDLSPSVQAFLRTGYGVLLAGTLLLTGRASRWFFVSERWGGYADSRPEVDWIQNPFGRVLVMGVWWACAFMLIAGRDTVLSALVNLALCWYFFIFMRWRGILRGMGAPGYFCYWLGACVFFLELARHCEPTGRLLPVAVLAFQVDFAVIMLCTGFYKFVAGYPQNHGMQLGLANPWWGYFWRFYRKLPYDHLLFRFLNHMAYLTQIGAGALMLLPPTRWMGALAIIGSFLFITTHIRLGFLCEMVIVSSFVMFEAGGPVDRLLSGWFPGGPVPQTFPVLPQTAALALAGFFWLYVAVLPFAEFGIWYNFLARRRFPEPFQTLLERWTNLFGIILWRVFSVDVINFFVRVWVRDAAGREEEYTRFGALDWDRRFRYAHVGEFVCLASIFTTCKYYPGNPELFTRKLVRYARTVPCPRGGLLRFEYRSLRPGAGGFDFRHVLDFLVDPERGTVETAVHDPEFDPAAAHEASPVHEGIRPGSYAPPAQR